jgi:hypothetical protein
VVGSVKKPLVECSLSAVCSRLEGAFVSCSVAEMIHGAFSNKYRAEVPTRGRFCAVVGWDFRQADYLLGQASGFFRPMGSFVFGLPRATLTCT